MGKLVTQDLANVLMEKRGVAKQEALRFVTAMFDVMQEGLNNDKLVKVKGLGTFKVIEVEARESVNVNTGDRVIIDSHSKITFTPDPIMKDLVNKPFSGFQTVILNEGIDFEDVDENDKENVTPEAVPAPVDSEAEETPEEEPAPVESEAEETLEEEPAPVEEIIEEPASAEEIIEEPVSVEEETPSADTAEEPAAAETPVEETSRDQAVFAPVVGLSYDEHRNFGRHGYHHGRRSRTSRILWPAALVVGCCLSFMGGYFFQRLSNKEAYVEAVDTVFVDENADPDDDLFSTVKPLRASASVGKDTESGEPSANTATQEGTQQPQELKPVGEQEEDYQKYEKMDFRVKTGAYRIVGTDTIIRSESGETLKSISDRILGYGMSCYLEVFNNIKSPRRLLEEGTMIRIPKLELKKSVRSGRYRGTPIE